MKSANKRVAVIGAGISGLTAALRLQQRGADVTLYEGSNHAGGVIRSEQRDGFLLEHGPDCFVSNKPAGLALCAELGIEPELISTNDAHRRSFILYKGKLEPLPQGFFLLAPTTIEALRGASILSLAGKIRLARELFIPPRKESGDESLASFVERRLGREALDRIAQPIVAGIYTADPARLSVQATFPQFLEMERKHGSILRALRHNAKQRGEESKAAGPRYGIFVSFKRGMQTLIDALRAKLTGVDLQLNTRVTGLHLKGERWQLDSSAERGARSAESPKTPDPGPRTPDFDAVVLALPAHAAAKLLSPVAAELATELAAIPYANSAVVNFAFKREQIKHALDGMGFVVPAIENRNIVGCSFSSVKFAGRAPEGFALMRVFMGGALQPEIAQWDDNRVRDAALAELREVVGARGEPVFATISRHRGSMAQYEVGHLERVARIESLTGKLPGLALAGNGFTGIGIPDCIRVATDAAKALRA
ncbi:MAG: protoporphyrinogen oxidase [Planctomycetes bacterium]|nr:protoporphyrinogen oxidase [Planctomycetota bacterium]